MNLSVIAALTDEGVIGKNNSLPWHLSEDLKMFKKRTMGHTIVMGRRTFDSLGKPLPGRTNVVVSRKSLIPIEGVQIFPSFEILEAELKKSRDEIFAIGGASVFSWAMPNAKHLYLTRIHYPFPGDTYFPAFDSSAFRKTDSQDYETKKYPIFRFTFETYERITV